jgi:hypothetical protein
MAATVLSGTGNVTYTNSTGQNVRVIVNYCYCSNTSSYSNPNSITVSWGSGATAKSSAQAFGRNLAYVSNIPGTANGFGNNMAYGSGQSPLPTEIMLAAGQTFSISGAIGSYNIVVIPEAG